MKKLLFAIALIVGCEDDDAPTTHEHDDGPLTYVGNDVKLHQSNTSSEHNGYADIKLLITAPFPN